jgi:murein L,D-transpeptidase YafK
VRALFAQAQVAFPPAQLLLRAFKRERRLEVWAASKAGAPLVHVTTYEICFASGRLGPKRRQGDGQVPEGFYTLGYLNPSSSYHLSMLVTYPNESDRILGDQRDPGGEIMIHGDCRSAGCLAMSDERIEELWVMCTALMWKLGGQVQIHIFPSRDMEQLLAAEPTAEHRELWQDLKGGLDRFERDKRLPRVQIERDGRYHFR